MFITSELLETTSFALAGVNKPVSFGYRLMCKIMRRKLRSHFCQARSSVHFCKGWQNQSKPIAVRKTADGPEEMTHFVVCKPLPAKVATKILASISSNCSWGKLTNGIPQERSWSHFCDHANPTNLEGAKPQILTYQCCRRQSVEMRLGASISESGNS